MGPGLVVWGKFWDGEEHYSADVKKVEVHRTVPVKPAESFAKQAHFVFVDVVAAKGAGRK